MAELFDKMIMSTFAGCWQPIQQLENKYRSNLLLCAPELVDRDCNPEGIGMGFWQDDGLTFFMSQEECDARDREKDYGCFLACKWDMYNDEWKQVACNPTDFILMKGPKDA